MVSDKQFQQYLRQLSLPNVGENGQAAICESHVLIVGCGGLGTAASMYLAGAGVGRIVIADDDDIELSNLPRQITYRSNEVGQSKVKTLADFLKAQNPDINVRTIKRRLHGSQLALEVSLADVVIDCTDNIKTRQAINKACVENRKALVTAAAIGWSGQLSVFQFSKLATPCYHCLYPFEELDTAMKCSESSVMGPVVGMMGVYQALEALKVITDLANSSHPELKLFDGLTGQWQSLKISHDETCSVCCDSKITTGIKNDPIYRK